ncbi:MAG: transposase [Trueperaceae bacterium]
MEKHKRFRKLSHSLYECKYHVVFCPKYGYRVLKDEVKGYVESRATRVISLREIELT